ncbi:MAG: HPF/RaiA family ribosome-associated protein [Verrucomicrobiae bacterium]|nr:HPF/RaiA family ribosome-associated protein [Verrucomicrobiae bacterium]
MQKFESLKLQLQYRGLHSNHRLEQLIGQSLEALRRLLPISTAHVVLEQQRDGSPAYRVRAHLAVPGPDVHAEATDHTLPAAWRKLAQKLSHQFQRRKARQQSRFKDRGLSRLAGQWSGAV